MAPAQQSLGGSRTPWVPASSYKGALPKPTGCFAGEDWDHEDIRRIQNRLKDTSVNYTDHFTLPCISSSGTAAPDISPESTAPAELEVAAAWAAGISCCPHGKPRGAVRSCPPLQIRVPRTEASNGNLHLPDTQGCKSLSKGLIHDLNTGVPLQGGQETALQGAQGDGTSVSFCRGEVMALELTL